MSQFACGEALPIMRSNIGSHRTGFAWTGFATWTSAGRFFAMTVACGASVIAAGCGVQEHLQGGQPILVSATGGASAPAPTTGGTSGGAASGGQGVTGSGGAVTGASGGSDVGPPPGGTGGSGTSSGGNTGTGTGSGGATVIGTGGRAASTGGSNGTGGAIGTGGAASGVTININGALVPKEKAIVFIHLGHSNMQGQATKPPETRAFFYDTQPGLWVYRGNNVFVAAKEPTAPQAPTDTKAGPGTALLKTAAAAAQPGYQFISIGRGQGSAPSPDYLKASNLLYPTVMNRAMELKGKVTFGAIFVMLGITERHLPAADQGGFPARIKSIIADMRADLGEPNLPVLFCDYEMQATGELAPNGVIGSAIRPMIQMLPGMISNLKLVPTDLLGMQDDHHFDFNGHKLWSERAIGILLNTPTWSVPWKK